MVFGLDLEKTRKIYLVILLLLVVNNIPFIADMLSGLMQYNVGGSVTISVLMGIAGLYILWQFHKRRVG